ncbi:MAG TPA: ATP-binding cassette domain-containing protein [Acidimicrobiales bacterium]|nr:ATP-binding cassette domain-containing protein [Acidimicrobiales bacterium]
MTLEFVALRRRYGAVLALDDLSFAVPVGQVFGFLGPNGAGKTTAMRAVFGLVDLDTGSVRWNGAAIGVSERRRFGYMPEARGLYPGMQIQRQLEYLCELHGRNASDARRATSHWLERLGIAARAPDKLESLSLGNQQRVQLAAALIHEPELLILDEPFAGLDPVGIDEVTAILTEQAREGRGVLFSSHQLDLVEDICESVAIIDSGHLVVAGNLDELERKGSRRLVVKVEGDRDGAWAAGIPGVAISRTEAGESRLVLDDTVDSQALLSQAMAAGPVVRFDFERRRLSEVFREAVR